MDKADSTPSGFGRSQWIATGLLLAVPVAPILKYVVRAPPVWIFAAGAVAIAVLADWIRRATEQAAKSLGPAIGGLMTVSFGSIAEIVLALFVLAAGNAEVVKAQITGSILGTSLLGLGLAIVVGTLGREQLRFKRERAGLLSSLFILVVIALLLPAAFDLAQRTLSGAPRMVDEVDLSLGVAIVLLALYAANLAYTLVTHRDVFAPDEPRDTEGAWPMAVSVGVLIGATMLVAMEAEAVSAALEATAASLGLSDIFVGVIVLALIGTASDLVAAVWFAKRGKVGLALSICVGSSIQVPRDRAAFWAQARHPQRPRVATPGHWGRVTTRTAAATPLASPTRRAPTRSCRSTWRWPTTRSTRWNLAPARGPALTATPPAPGNAEAPPTTPETARAPTSRWTASSKRRRRTMPKTRAWTSWTSWTTPTQHATRSRALWQPTRCPRNCRARTKNRSSWQPPHGATPAASASASATDMKGRLDEKGEERSMDFRCDEKGLGGPDDERAGTRERQPEPVARSFAMKKRGLPLQKATRRALCAWRLCVFRN